MFLFPLLWEVGHRGSCCDLCQSVLPIFSFKSLIVSHLIFRSLINFEFIFVYGVRKCSSFILSQVVDQFSRHHLTKEMKETFPGGSDSESVCLQCGRPGLNPWLGKILWRRKWQPTLVLLPGKCHRWRSLVGYNPWNAKKIRHN